MAADFATITELPGTLLSPEQWRRFVHRYAVGLRESSLADSPARVLEVGCGAGIGLAAWQEAAQARGGFVAGLEYVERSLQEARTNLGSDLPLLCGDAQLLPFADGSFDAIASFEVIYYLPDPAVFLRESRRLLAPGGNLILCWSNPEWATFVPGQQSGHYPTLGEVAGLMQSAGFDQTKYFGAFPSTTSGKQVWVNRVRQVAVRSGATRLLGNLTAPLMQAAYGELRPLPKRLTLAEIEAETPAVTPLERDAHDRIHRVLYAVARVSHLTL